MATEVGTVMVPARISINAGESSEPLCTGSFDLRVALRGDSDVALTKRSIAEGLRAAADAIDAQL